MGRAPCCDKKGLKRGKWSLEEDQKLISHIQQFGHPKWSTVPKLAGLLRCGKSCRLRWTNYLRPDLKREKFTTREEEAIIQLQQILGNRWSAIAAELPGRTDNDIKNHWRTHLWKRQLSNSVMASTDTTDICYMIDNNNEGDSTVNSEPESESMANNLTTTATIVAVVEEGDRDKGKNVGSDSLYSEEDIWDDLLLEDNNLLMAEKSGFEALTLAASSICDDKTNTHTWWLDDDDDEKVLELSDG